MAFLFSGFWSLLGRADVLPENWEHFNLKFLKLWTVQEKRKSGYA
jgi:hypothetical protein